MSADQILDGMRLESAPSARWAKSAAAAVGSSAWDRIAGTLLDAIEAAVVEGERG